MTPEDGTGKNDDRSLASRIAAVLAERIVSGELAPDAPVRQDHVAAAFGASHVPVREAFRKLEAQGLVVALPRRGVRVAPLDPRTVLEVTEMRAALECLALRRAFPMLQPSDLESAATALAEGQATQEITAWERANRAFHRALIAPCALPRLLATVDDLHRADARFLHATWRVLDWQPRSETEHSAILDALAARALDQALRLLEQHILAAGQALADALGSG